MADDKDNGADDGLDACLRRHAALNPARDLVARVLADADRGRAAARGRPPPEPAGRIVRSPPSWIAALGGWGGFGGVTAAGLVGLALGFWSPDWSTSSAAARSGRYRAAGRAPTSWNWHWRLVMSEPRRLRSAMGRSAMGRSPMGRSPMRTAPQTGRGV
jgi:hypothetical protein